MKDAKDDIRCIVKGFDDDVENEWDVEDGNFEEKNNLFYFKIIPTKNQSSSHLLSLTINNNSLVSWTSSLA